MTATDVLKEQHRSVEALLRHILSSQSNVAALVERLAKELLAHMIVEQTVLYPAARSIDETHVLESYEEHAVARFELSRLLTKRSTDPTFRARVKTLHDLLNHHVQEEEERFLPRMDAALGASVDAELRARMHERFVELVECDLDELMRRARHGGSPSRVELGA